MIPKVIHYCWFGKGEMPESAKKCIKSWKKFCPDYEIKEWNEDNFDIENVPLYVKQAYEAKKWAFVTDYVRLFALYNYGGIYMDTDVEVIKSLDDLLILKGFFGFESEDRIQTGIIASEKSLPVIKELLDEYNNISFYCWDGTYNLMTNVTKITYLFSKYGLTRNNKLQVIKDFTIYPREYFCPISYKYRYKDICITKNTVTIHHFAGSWLEKTSFNLKNIKYKIRHSINILIIRLKLKCYK